MEIVFWILVILIAYTYLGYALLIALWVLLQKKAPEVSCSTEDLPEVTLLIAAYNEKDFVEKKILNSRQLDYPKDKLTQIWVTDGSDDGTPDLLRQYDDVTVLHQDERRGKTAALNRAIDYVKTPIVVFCDGNTLLTPNTLKAVCSAFADEKVGCVAGEKRILEQIEDNASGSGEGIYWKYESMLKRLDSEFYSTVGGVGELFAVRTHLFEKIDEQTILDDFVITMGIALKGYKIKYVPEAKAVEGASANVKEELKRKVRIAAGGFQSIQFLPELLNIFKHPKLSFQFYSRKLFRWLLVPLALFLLLPLNIFIVLKNGSGVDIYSFALLVQLVFYAMVVLGYALSNVKIRQKLLFVPYYVFVMNYAALLGAIRFLKGKQSVKWERAKRA